MAKVSAKSSGGRIQINVDLKTEDLTKVFCPTGPGGGVDPTCSPGGGRGPTDGPASDPTTPPAEISLASKDPRQQKAAMEIAFKILKTNKLDDIAAVVGALPGHKATVDVNEWGGSRASAEGTDTVVIKADGINAKYKLGIDSKGRSYVENEEVFFAKAIQGQGIGTKMFRQQVEAAGRLGVSYITLQAAKKNPISPSKPHNGYYTWPRFGFDAPIDQIERDTPKLGVAIRSRFPEAKSLLDVMSTKDGREWWKQNGDDVFDARFDLTPGSRSMQIFEAYKSERSKGN